MEGTDYGRGLQIMRNRDEIFHPRKVFEIKSQSPETSSQSLHKGIV